MLTLYMYCMHIIFVFYIFPPPSVWVVRFKLNSSPRAVCSSPITRIPPQSIPRESRECPAPEYPLRTTTSGESLQCQPQNIPTKSLARLCANNPWCAQPQENECPTPVPPTPRVCPALQWPCLTYSIPCMIHFWLVVASGFFLVMVEGSCSSTPCRGAVPTSHTPVLLKHHWRFPNFRGPKPYYRPSNSRIPFSLVRTP